MLQNILGHLPTTLVGLGAAALIALGNYLQTGGTITLQGALSAVFVAIFGAVVTTGKQSS